MSHNKCIEKLASFGRAKVRLKILFFMYFSFIWNSVRHKLISSILCSSPHTCINCNKSHYNEDIENRRFNRKCLETIDEQVEINLGIPKICCYWRLYYIISTLTHISIIINSTILFYRIKYIGLNQNDYFLCYSPRFVFHEVVSQYNMTVYAWCISLSHVIWRLINVALKNENLDLIPFINSNDKLFQKLLSINKYRKQSNKQNQNSTLTPSEITYKEAYKDNKDCIINFMLNIMYLNIYESSKLRSLKFVIRPNRTIRARNELIWVTNIAFNTSLLVFITIWVLAAPSPNWTLMFYQTKIYIGCQPNYNVIIWFYRYFVSLYITSILFFDSIFALLMPTNMAFILVYDLFIYWRSIMQKMNSLTRLLIKYRLEISVKDNEDEDKLRITSSTKTMDTYRTHKNEQIILDQELKNLIVHDSQQTQLINRQNRFLNYYAFNVNKNFQDVDLCHNLRHTKKFELIDGKDLRKEICLLQHLIGDFFSKQLRKINQWVSILVRFTLGAWLFLNAFITLTGLQLNNNAESHLVKIVQILGLMVITIMTYGILTLKRRTTPGYRIMSTLMALDPTQSKKRWIALLKYYSEKPNYGITLFKNQIFSSLTYLKLLSYTFTFIALVENIKRY